MAASRASFAHLVLFQSLDGFQMFFPLAYTRFFVVRIFADILRDAFLDALPLESLERYLDILVVSDFNRYQIRSQPLL